MSETDSGDVRGRIVAEASRLFVAHGYHGISMREIAEAVGVSKAGLYYHFKDKEELFLAILNECLGSLGAAIAAALPGGGGVRGRVAAILAAIFAQPAEQRAVMRLATSELGHLGAEARAAFGQRYHREFIGQIEAALREGVASGELRPIDVRAATWVLLGMAYPFFTPSEQRDGAAGGSQSAIATILGIFFDGAASRA